jgi:pimeloyl-ACP methyl ester carboxylesterase
MSSSHSVEEDYIVVPPYTNDNPQYVQLSDGKTRYLLQGTADSPDNNELLVCIHGIGSYSYTFQFLAEHLLNRVKLSNFQVLRYDLYGRGLSDYPDKPHTAELFVRQLYELLCALNIVDKASVKKTNDSRVITLLGHSMGGAIATAFCDQYPNLIDQLILFTPAGTKFSMPFGASLLHMSGIGESILNLKTYLTDIRTGIMEEFFDSKVSERGVDWIMKYRSEMDNKKLIQSFLNSFRNFPLQGLTEALRRVGKAFAEKRVLIIWAMYDTTIPATDSFIEYLNAFQSPSHQFVIMADTRHTFHLERIDDTNQLVRNFLEARKSSSKSITDGVHVKNDWRQFNHQKKDKKLHDYWVALAEKMTKENQEKMQRLTFV